MHRSHASLALSLIALAAACAPSDGGGSAGSGAVPTGAPSPSALRPAHPQPLVDPNQGGAAPALQLTGVFRGRLVDVYASGAQGGPRELVHPDFLIAESIASDGVDYELETLHGSGEVQLTILHPQGSAAYAQALDGLQQNLTPIQDAILPPFTMVPRNAALELRFQDLLDPATVTAETVRLAVGYPPEVPFEARVVPDPNHGDLADPDGDGLFELFPTRVIVDLTVDELDALESDPPLPVNPVGLPGATTTNASNLRLRLPTRAAPGVGQTEILRNLAGNGLSFTGNGSNDPNAPTRDIIRRLRSGGPGDLTGDTYEGFLSDDEAPSIVGRLEVTLAGAPVPDPDRPGVFTFASWSYPSPSCAPEPDVGDRVQIAGVWTVLEGYSTHSGVLVGKPRVRVVYPPDATPQPGPAELTTRFEPAQPDCWLDFLPSAASPPNLGVSPEASIELAFDEPMADGSLRPLEGYVLSRTPLAPDAFQLVVGEVVASADARSFLYVPSLPLTHAQGSSEAYYVQVGQGANAPTDLVGNPLGAAPDNMLFTLDRSAASVSTGGLALRFESADELYGDGLPELRGQHRYDLQAGVLRPRPLTRFSVAADTDKPIPSVMTPFPPGVQVPLTPLGAKLHSLWRYVDLGWNVLDESLTNVDVEGLAWAPVGGQAITDVYDEFSIGLAHSAWLPDEYLNTFTGFPTYPNSGLVFTYANNLLPSPEGGPTVVHPRERGYVVNPADLFTAESGKTMMPWPLNRGIPVEDFEYYTWRDTALEARAGFSTSGVLLAQEVAVLGLPASLIGSVYRAGNVRSLGLPLLIEYRCYPDDSALGLNAFEILLAANSSARPNFRAFSAGGYNTGGQPVIVDPDQSHVASGGFSPTSNPPGQPTPPADNAFYTGQVDLVTRVARSHSVWLPAGFTGSVFAEPVVNAELPPGTQLQLAWRGAEQIAGFPLDITTDAGQLDPYGDPTPLASSAPVFLGGDPSWKDDLAELDGAAWIQLRITFVANAASGETAALDTLGVAWTQ